MSIRLATVLAEIGTAGPTRLHVTSVGRELAQPRISENTASDRSQTPRSPLREAAFAYH